MSQQQQQQQQQPASLMACNEQLLDVLQDLRAKRAEVHRNVLRAEEEKGRVERQIEALKGRLNVLTAELSDKLQARAGYDRTIRETEIAYTKIVESSETLLRVLRREATHLASSSSSLSSQQHQQPPPHKGVGVYAASSLPSSSSSLVNGRAMAGSTRAATGAGYA